MVLIPAQLSTVFSVRGKSDMPGEVEKGFVKETAFQLCSKNG